MLRSTAAQNVGFALFGQIRIVVQSIQPNTIALVLKLTVKQHIPYIVLFVYMPLLYIYCHRRRSRGGTGG